MHEIRQKKTIQSAVVLINYDKSRVVAEASFSKYRVLIFFQLCMKSDSDKTYKIFLQPCGRFEKSLYGCVFVNSFLLKYRVLKNIFICYLFISVSLGQFYLGQEYEKNNCRLQTLRLWDTGKKKIVIFSFLLLFSSVNALKFLVVS